MSVQWEFIEELEGPSVKVGYIPYDGDEGDVGKEPGVTVGAGFDIGQRSENDLLKLNLGYEIVEKLAPYTNKTGTKAEAFLEQNPLILTDEEVETIDNASRQRFTNRVQRRWNNDVVGHSEVAWDELTDEQQTVVMSVSWQYGSPWKRCPTFWGCATRGDWAGVVDELRDFGDAFNTRRNREADYLS